jgi:hypothetical protein
MKLSVKCFLALALASLAGCGGTRSAAINFPFVRTFNGADGNSTIQMQFHDLSSNLLSTSQSVTLGTVNIPNQDANFVYTQGTVTMLDVNSSPLYEAASTTFAQNMKYTCFGMGTTNTYSILTLTDSEVNTGGANFGFRAVHAATAVSTAVDVYVLAAGTTTPTGGDIPVLSNLKYSVAPSTANAATADGNGYVLVPTGGATTFSLIFCATGTQVPIFPAQQVTVVSGDYYTAALWDTGTSPAQSDTFLTDNR